MYRAFLPELRQIVLQIALNQIILSQFFR